MSWPEVDGTGSPVQPEYVYTYDKYGNQLTQEDEGRVTRFAYDSQHRRIRRSLPAALDVDGNPLTFAAEHSFYDERGRLRARSDFAGNLTVFTYDDQDNVPGAAFGRQVHETVFAKAEVEGLLSIATDWRDHLGDADGTHEADDRPGLNPQAVVDVDGEGPLGVLLAPVLAEADGSVGSNWGWRTERALGHDIWFWCTRGGHYSAVNDCQCDNVWTSPHGGSTA